IKVDYLRLAQHDPSKRPDDLTPLFQRGKYDAYILRDIASDAFRPDELAALAHVVQQGAGLIMLGGYHTFGPGGYGSTPLANVLPIEMSHLERQQYGDPIQTD